MTNKSVHFPFQVQNALRSFAELSDSLPEGIKPGFKLSKPLEATDESGRALTSKEFAKVSQHTLYSFREQVSMIIKDELKA